MGVVAVVVVGRGEEPPAEAAEAVNEDVPASTGTMGSWTEGMRAQEAAALNEPGRHRSALVGAMVPGVESGRPLLSIGWLRVGGASTAQLSESAVGPRGGAVSCEGGRLSGYEWMAWTGQVVPRRDRQRGRRRFAQKPCGTGVEAQI